MPFTFAHPAAALPLKRLLGRFACMPALAIGSMMPDLPFFLGIALPREHSHDPASLLSWSLPAGLLMYAVFQLLVRPALVDLAPAQVQRRVRRDGALPRTPAGWAAVALSLVAGAATHQLWDAFTHPGTHIVNALPLLQISLGSVGQYPLYIFKMLQHASTALGLTLLTGWACRWYARTPPDAAGPALPAIVRWFCVLALALVPLAAGAWAAWHANADAKRLATFVFTTLPVFFWLLMAFALGRRLTEAP